jgi:hypothetical protein
MIDRVPGQQLVTISTPTNSHIPCIYFLLRGSAVDRWEACTMTLSYYETDTLKRPPQFATVCQF